MPILATIQTAAVAIAGFIIFAIFSALVGANVRRLAAEKGWDSIFLRAWNAAPEVMRNMLSSWLPLRQLWWLWLSLGLSGGLGMALWLLAPARIHATPAPDIEKAMAPIRAELEATKQQLQVARQVAAPVPVPTALPPIKWHLGPLTTLQIVQTLAMFDPGFIRAPAPPGSNPIELHWAFVISASKENADIATVIGKLITARLEAFELDLPDRSVNLDAPAFPEPGEAGITLHGTNVLNQRLLQVLAQCFIVRITSHTIDGLKEWYGNRIDPGRNLVWIEIGRGSPWKIQIDALNKFSYPNVGRDVPMNLC